MGENKKENLKKMAVKRVDDFISLLPPEPRSYDVSDDSGFWTKDGKIYCPSETEAEVIAEFLRDALAEYAGADIRTERCEEHSGFWCVEIEVEGGTK